MYVSIAVFRLLMIHPVITLRHSSLEPTHVFRAWCHMMPLCSLSGCNVYRMGHETEGNRHKGSSRCIADQHTTAIWDQCPLHECMLRGQGNACGSRSLAMDTFDTYFGTVMGDENTRPV